MSGPKRGGFAKNLGIPKADQFSPTDEQLQALDLFVAGESLAIEAGAGTGKTSTLKMLAEATEHRGQYTAFNKSIVEESALKFPRNVRCNTSHSLAFRAVGKNYQHRLSSKRMRSSELAARLDVHPIMFNVGGARKVLSPWYLGSLVMRTIERFCQTADMEPSTNHVPYIDGIDLHEEDGRRGWENNRDVREELLPVIRRAWQDILRIDGHLPFKHAHYLKMWQLNEPIIDADFLLTDEMQDTAEVMADVILQQQERGTQIIVVGDSQQEIYGWAGAINSIGMFGLEHTTYLTQSFRFGPAVAEIANAILDGLEAPIRLKGYEPIPSEIGAVTEPDAILTRTNATAVRQLLLHQQAGKRPVYLMGGGLEVLSFARAVNDLNMMGRTNHPDLACFDSYPEVCQYVREDPQGSELKLMVDLIEEFGTQVIEDALNKTVPEKTEGAITVSTAHKAKGREWGQVVLASDFGPKTNPETGSQIAPSAEEQRLLYVAVTRAQHRLDISAVPQLQRRRA